MGQRVRSERYEAAMAGLHARHPKDTEVTAFYALALLEAVDLTDKSLRPPAEGGARSSSRFSARIPTIQASPTT